MERENAPRWVRFGVFDLDVRTGELRKSGVRLKLQEQPFQILRDLVLEPGELITREQLQEKLWPDGTFVDFDHRLNAAVQKLRDLLNDSARNPRFIETLPKKGYRFVAPVEPLVDQDEPEPRKANGKRRRWTFAVAAAAIAGAAAVAAWRSSPTSELNPDRLTETSLTSYPGSEIHPSFSPDGSQIAYAARRGGGSWSIFVEVVDSGQPRQLTDSAEDDVAPVWAPDGRSLAFVRMGSLPTDNVLMVMPASGGPAREVVKFERRVWAFVNASWSPDGERLAYSGRPDPEGPLRIGSIPVDGGEPEWLTAPEPHLVGDVTPVFSPDGSQLAFVRCEGATSGINVFGLSLSANYQPVGGPRQLTSFDRLALAPAWLPRGKEILFIGEQGPGQEGLWSVPSSGSHEPRLRWRHAALVPDGLPGIWTAALAAGLNAAGDLQIAHSVENRNLGPVLYRVDLVGPAKGKPIPFLQTTDSTAKASHSPDGRRIAYVAGSRTREIWISDADGGNRQRLTNLGSRVISPLSWSPDGRKILFHARTAGPAAIYVMDVDSRKIDRLTDGGADDNLPAWSRDGRSIYFVSNRTGDWAIWKMGAAGEQPNLALDRHAGTIEESWDGRTLYFSDDTGKIWRLPLGADHAQPSIVVADANHTVPRFQVAQSGLYLVSRAGMLMRYEPHRERLEELLPVEGEWSSIHPEETSVLLTVRPPVESDLKMLRE